MNLAEYGWNAAWAERLAASPVPGGVPARVVAEHRDRLVVRGAAGEREARVAGRFRGAAATAADRPVVGDWVVVAEGEGDGPAVVQAVLPRLSAFSRKAAGTRTEEQVLAANVDTAWIVSSFGTNLNAARVERYVAMVWESGASPVVVLTKADLSADADGAAAEMRDRVVGVPVHPVSVVSGFGIDALRGYLAPGRTVALLGSSGVGKSTLLNHLAGREIMRVAEVRAGDGKGRHTTTHRELVPLPGGALLLDTPGMRELHLWSADGGVAKTFGDIEALAATCRFADCGHDTEPDCAVRAAVESGDLAPERLESYRKLLREQAYLERRVDPETEREQRDKIRRIMREYRRTMKKKR